MMMNVPQFIDVEDRIVGPLTWRQLLWMIGMGAILLILYNFVSIFAFVVAAIPIVMLFVALAFYRPNNQPLILYVIYAAIFLFRPKVAVWERPVGGTHKKKEAPAPVVEKPKDKHMTLEELKQLAATVDRGHRQSSI